MLRSWKEEKKYLFKNKNNLQIDKFYCLKLKNSENDLLVIKEFFMSNDLENILF